MFQGSTSFLSSNGLLDMTHQIGYGNLGPWYQDQGHKDLWQSVAAKSQQVGWVNQHFSHVQVDTMPWQFFWGARSFQRIIFVEIC